MSKDTTYRIFDNPDYDEGATLRVTSNANIHAVCLVLCEHEPHTFKERHHYAEIGEIQPDRYEETKDGEKEAIYAFTNRTSSDPELFARLAETLFMDAPDLTGTDPKNEDRIIITNTELSDTLIRDQVWKALNDFFLSFGSRPYEPDPLFGDLPNALIGKITEQMFQQTPTEKPGSDSIKTPTSGASA